MTDPFLSFLGLCRRANALKNWHDAVKDAVRGSKAELVLLSSNASERLEKEIRNLSNTINVVRTDRSTDDIGASIGKRAGILAVTDKNLASAVIKKYEEGMKHGN